MTNDADLQSDRNQFKQFSKLWPGGYCEGNPLDPTSGSTYGAHGYNSILYTIYLTCIKPYITPQSTVLEIGPGRGAWTKTFLHLGAKEIWCLDAAPAEHTGFYEYVGDSNSLNYICVNDAFLREIRDNSIDYFFSFGVFCHVEQSIIKTYLQNLSSKMKTGGNGFLMVGDFEKYNRCIGSKTIFDAPGSWMLPFRVLWNALKIVSPRKYIKKELSLEDKMPLSKKYKGLGRWHHLSTGDACTILESYGFTIVDRDMGVCQRDPVIHFVKS